MSAEASLPPGALQAALAALNLNTTIGSLLVGGLVSAVLFGITTTQTFVYYQKAAGDLILIKGVVTILWMLDAFDMCLITHILYWYLIKNYGNPLALQNPVWSIILHVMVTATTETIVRGMFAWRVYRLSQGKWFSAAFIAIVSSVDLVVAVVITVKAFHTTFLGLKKLDPLVYVEFASGFAGDAMVALSLCYLLHKSRTGFGRTESVINVLMAYVVNTGLLTAVTSSVSLILFATQQNNLIYVAVYLQLSKLYVNAYLAMLNGRGSLRERSNELVSLHVSRLSATRAGTYPGTNGAHALQSYHKEDPMGVVVETQVHTAVDSDDYKGRSYSPTEIPYASSPA